MKVITKTITLIARLEKVSEFITKPENFPKYVLRHLGLGSKNRNLFILPRIPLA